MKIISRWLLIHSLVASLGLACVWTFSPSDNLIPLVGAGFALGGSVIAWFAVD